MGGELIKNSNFKNKIKLKFSEKISSLLKREIITPSTCAKKLNLN